MTTARKPMPSSTLAAVTALIVSFGSLSVAWRQSVLMERQLAASVWPVLQFNFRTRSTGTNNRAHVRLGLRNGGIGPAIIRAFDLSYQGKPIVKMAELVAVCGAQMSEVLGLQTAPVAGNMIPAGERLEFFSLERAVDDSSWQQLEDVRAHLSGHICYCSALNDCWLLDITKIEPAAVSDCTAAARRPQYEAQ